MIAFASAFAAAFAATFIAAEIRSAVKGQSQFFVIIGDKKWSWPRQP